LQESTVNLLNALLVQQPENILAVAALFLIAYCVAQFTHQGSHRHPRLLLVATIAWAAYAAWEWLTLVSTPEANIRVDLLIIWPVLAMLSSWALFRAFR
jgi:hypothetical protein